MLNVKSILFIQCSHLSFFFSLAYLLHLHLHICMFSSSPLCTPLCAWMCLDVRGGVGQSRGGRPVWTRVNKGPGN